jgi:leucyl/phenylalanyl-tRNA--protein transferase
MRGIFPWFGEDDPLLWWSPDPRMVLFLDELHVARSLRRVIRSGRYEVRFDTAFRDVMLACGEPRVGQDGTWITPAMIEAYTTLERLGYAHSIESWADGELVGGLYGVAIGRMFYGESMFTRRSDASKVAFVCDRAPAGALGLSSDRLSDADHASRLVGCPRRSLARSFWTISEVSQCVPRSRRHGTGTRICWRASEYNESDG